MRIPVLTAAALVIAAPALAQSSNQVAVTSTIQAVKLVTDANGRQSATLVPATTVLPDTALVFWLKYKNTAAKPATGFEIKNPMPKNVWFTKFGPSSDWGDVSVDGGKTYGALATLKVPGAGGALRAAGQKDVTHVRWSFKTAIGAGSSGTVAFYGVVK